ncbi:MAG: hypothetical protein FVQ84_18180 [Planctomycetes bacterium]|nr:hypothetical protein [Planctomycetota bacterium]
MDPIIIAALIGAFGAITAAVITIVARGRQGTGSITPIKRNSKTKERSEWINRLNDRYRGHAEIVRLVESEPKLVNRGWVKLTPRQSQKADQIREGYIEEGWSTDPYGLLDEEPQWHDNPVLLHYRMADQAQIVALRKARKKPRVLSTSVVLCFPESQELLLHRRNRGSATYAEHLHTVGGSYLSQAKKGCDEKSLTRTGVREVREETGLFIAGKNCPKKMLCQETATGFVQFVMIGIAVGSDQKRELLETSIWEGKYVLVPFSELPGKLISESEKWVPSGKMHVLSWLALGAPGCSAGVKFGTYAPEELFDRIVGSG